MLNSFAIRSFIPNFSPYLPLSGGEGGFSEGGEELLRQLLEGMDVRQWVEETAQPVSRCLGGEGNPEQLLATLGQAMLREGSDFHSLQMIDAGFSQYNDRRGTEEGRHVLIAVARFLAAHAPTPRAVGQTYNMALRLHRGEEIYRDA